MVDLTFLETFTKGNSVKMNRYISMYLKIAPEIFDRMQSDIKTENWSDLAINAHSLKPQADYMGIKSLKEVLGQIEIDVNSGNTSNLKVLFKDAFMIHQSAAIILEQQIK